MNDIMQYWREKWNKAGDHSKATNRSRLLKSSQIDKNRKKFVPDNSIGEFIVESSENGKLHSLWKEGDDCFAAARKYQEYALQNVMNYSYKDLNLKDKFYTEEELGKLSTTANNLLNDRLINMMWATAYTSRYFKKFPEKYRGGAGVSILELTGFGRMFILDGRTLDFQGHNKNSGFEKLPFTKEKPTKWTDTKDNNGNLILKPGAIFQGWIDEYEYMNHIRKGIKYDGEIKGHSFHYYGPHESKSDSIKIINTDGTIDNIPMYRYAIIILIQHGEYEQEK